MNPVINPARAEHARARRRRMDLWRHRVRQVAVAEMALKRVANNGGTVDDIMSAMDRLARVQHAAGMVDNAA